MNSSNSGHPSPKILLTHFKWTVDRFEEILKNQKTDYYRDAALQRFTFTCEMAFKLIRSLAAEQGKHYETLHQCFQWAAENNWLAKDAPWQEMTESFRLAAEKLKGEQADREFEKLSAYYRLMKSLYQNLTAVANK